MISLKLQLPDHQEGSPDCPLQFTSARRVTLALCDRQQKIRSPAANQAPDF